MGRGMRSSATVFREKNLEQTAHNSATKLEALAPGQAFRFYFRGKVAVGLKAQFTHGARGDAALVLTSTKSLQPGALLSGFDVGDVVKLAGAKIGPSTKSGTIAPGKLMSESPAKSSFTAAG